VSETAPPVFANDFIRFYWTAPGVYSVQYNSVSGAATASFSVLGPTNVKVVPDPSQSASIKDVHPTCPGLPQSINSVVWGIETEKMIPGKPFSPGISFLATADEPTKGVFQWEQLTWFNSESDPPPDLQLSTTLEERADNLLCIPP
jgi:hypothetical protein